MIAGIAISSTLMGIWGCHLRLFLNPEAESLSFVKAKAIQYLSFSILEKKIGIESLCPRGWLSVESLKSKYSCFSGS